LIEVKGAERQEGHLVRVAIMEDVVAATPLSWARASDGQMRLMAAGAWTAPNAAELERLVQQLTLELFGCDAASIDMRAIERFDTYGALLLARLSRLCQPLRVIALADRYKGLFQELQRIDPHALEAPTRGNANDHLKSLARGVAEIGRNLIALANMLGALSLGLVAILRRPMQFRLISAVHQLDRVAWQAVPIILLITFLIGGIIAQQGFFHFRKFGAEEYVVDMVGILVLREIGVLIVAIMVAGRSGSSYTAELGSMKMREEIDALHTMGFDPVDILLLPRVIALIIALPLLTFLGAMAALFGGGLVAWLYGGMSPEIFLSRLREAISLTHFQVGLIKAPCMALAIGVVACSEGLQVEGSAESLGLKTTASVVKSIFLVIVLDGLFAIFFASIGM
jgi:phospholipid/cholesterol/gamma-HCH transport system permease protein